MKLQQFILELRSRKVYHTAAVYCAGAWALLQVADVIFPVVGLPDWTISAVLVIAAIGFPVALLLSWLFELTPEGVAPVPTAEPVKDTSGLPASRVIELTVIILLSGLVGYLYLVRLGEPPQPVQRTEVSSRSIAVMPFVNLSNQRDMEYLGDGLAEEILNLLARLTELNVAARTSSFYFKDKEVDIRTVGESLGVAHVLEGSVRFSGDRVRVTAQLIKADDGFHLWSQTYDREMQDVLAIQDEIAGQVVEKLQLLLSPDSRELLRRESSADPAAYDYYLRGRAYLRSPADRSNLEYALGLFEKAIALDPDFADAHAGQCDAQLALYTTSRDADDYALAEQACEQALRLDRRSPSVYIALGQLYRASGQYEQAVKEFELALSLGAMQADAYLGLGDTYFETGEMDKAEESYRTALDLQPRYWRALMQMARLMFAVDRVDESIPYYITVTELRPESDLAYNNLGAAHFLLGDFNAASEAWKHSLALAPSAITFSNMATSLFMLGEFDQAVRLYHQAVERAPKDYELWGNLADAYRHSSVGMELAMPMYENAIRLASELLQINATDAYALGLVAHYHAAIGDGEQALDYLGNALLQAPENMYVNYSGATVYAALEQPGLALDHLEAALGLGFPRHIAAADANLEALKGLSRFETLVGQAPGAEPSISKGEEE